MFLRTYSRRRHYPCIAQPCSPGPVQAQRLGYRRGFDKTRYNVTFPRKMLVNADSTGGNLVQNKTETGQIKVSRRVLVYLRPPRFYSGHLARSSTLLWWEKPCRMKKICEKLISFATTTFCSFKVCTEEEKLLDAPAQSTLRIDFSDRSDGAHGPATAVKVNSTSFVWCGDMAERNNQTN